MTSVLHFHHHWLPPSEPFVWDLIRCLPGPSIVVSDREPEHVDRFPADRLVDLTSFDHVPVRLRQAAITARLLLLMARHRTRVVHTHHGYAVGRVAGACRRARVPLVVSFHGHDVFGWVDQHPGFYDRHVCGIDAAIVPSQFLVSHVEQLGVPVSRIHVIGSGVDTGFFTPSPVPRNHEVLFVGRFVEKKGLDVLAQAWPTVRERVPAATLRVLGFGPLEHLAHTAGATVEEAPDRGRVRDAIRACRVVVSPSRTASDDVADTLLMVNLEAQASGRPVVTTDHGGIPEYVDDGRSGLVVPEADPVALAEALVRVLTDDSLARRLGAAGPATVAPQSAPAVAARVDALHRSLLP